MDLFDRAVPEPNSGCWIWCGATNSGVYPWRGGWGYENAGGVLLRGLGDLGVYGKRHLACHIRGRAAR